MSAGGQRRFRNVLITGLPGVGKSTFAKAYAQMSRTELVELDTYVERLAGKSVADIFAEDGEAAFRELEAQCLERLLRRQRCTIALGGGTLSHPNSLALARELGCIVLLTAPAAVVAARLWPEKDKRPLLADCVSQEQLQARLEQLLESRRSSYDAADLVLETTYSSVDTLKIELGWLERSLLDGLQNNQASASEPPDAAAPVLRKIPLADPSYRSPREQRTGKDTGDKLERLLKAQRHKERSEKRDRGGKKERKPRPAVQGQQQEKPEGGPRPVQNRPKQEKPEGGPRPVQNRPQQEKPEGGPRPRTEVGAAPVPRPRQDSRPVPRNQPAPQGEASDRAAAKSSDTPAPTDKPVPVPRT